MNIPDQTKQSLTLTDLEDLEKSGLIPLENQPGAQSLFRQSIQWKDWIIRSGGILGLLFFLSGVVFFFASNWKAMSPLFRFGLLEGGVIMATLVAMWRGLGKVSGQSALLIASMLTGVLLAVYGQVYQTGADAFEVYALWAGLILLWVIAGRSIGLWTLWIAVAQTAIALYAGQVLTPSGVSWEVGFLALGLFNLVILAAWELLHRRDSFSWLRVEWFRPLVLAAGLFWLSAAPVRWIFEYKNHQHWGDLFWLVVVAAVLFYYYRIRPNVVAFGIGLIAAATIVVLRISRTILDHDVDIGGLFLTAVLSLLVFGGAATLLVKFSQVIRKGETA